MAMGKIAFTSRIAFLVFTFLLIASSSLVKAQVFFTEDFNDDGTGTRYTIQGQGQDLNATDGPAFWDHSFSVGTVGEAAIAPAKRAAILWDDEIDPNLWTNDALDVFDSLVDWAIDGKNNANILITSPGGVILAQSDVFIQQRLESQGHTVNGSDGADPLPPANSVDLVLHSDAQALNPATVLNDYAVPVITWNAENHDDMAVSTKFLSVTASPSRITIEEPTHPAAGGKTGNINWTTSPQPLNGIGNTTPPGSTIVASVRDSATNQVLPAVLAIDSGGELLGGGFSGSEGSGFFAGADMDFSFGGGADAANPRSLTLNPIDVAGKEDLQLTVALAATTLDFEAADYLRILVDRDNGGNFETIAEFTGDVDPANLKSISDGTTTLTQTFQDVTYDLIGGGTDLVIRFEAISTFFNEIVGIDNIRLSGVTLTLDGSGQSYFEDFDSLGTSIDGGLPKGWRGEDQAGRSGAIDSLGLIDGPLEGAVASVAGIVNVGGNADRFSTPTDGRVGTWKDDLDGSGVFDGADVVADGATDRAIGNARVGDTDVGSVSFEIEISNRPLRAFVAEWDFEVWGGDPETAFRGSEGAGYAADLSVGGTSYYSETVSLKPGDLFDSAFDLAPNNTHDPSLINGNEHAVRGNSSGIVEVSPADGAVGNKVNFTFDADFAGADGGWITAVDNVLIRALAAGDAQADGDVDPADLIQLLAGGAFGQGNIDATWGQGDFDNDGDFDGTDILAVVQGLAGEFPKVYSHDPSNGVPDVLINPATGNITLDTNGTTIGSIVMDSAAGIFNGPNSPMWDAPGDFAADIDTQISMPISFTNPGYTGVDDLGDGIIGDLAPGFDILADLTIKYLDPNGDLLDAEAHVVPEPSSLLLLALGGLSVFASLRLRRRKI